MLIVCRHNNRPALYGSLDRRKKAPVKISRSSEEVGRMSNSRQSRFNRCDKEWSTDRLIRCWMLWGYDGDYDDVVVDGLRWKGILSMLFHWGIQRLTELDGIPRNWDFLSYICSGGERMPVPVALTEAENDGEPAMRGMTDQHDRYLHTRANCKLDQLICEWQQTITSLLTWHGIGSIVVNWCAEYCALRQVAIRVALIRDQGKSRRGRKSKRPVFVHQWIKVHLHTEELPISRRGLWTAVE